MVLVDGVIYEVYRDKYNKFNDYAIVIAPEYRDTESITISSHIDGVKVTKIQQNAFSGMQKLETVFTEDLDSLIIEKKAFANCPKLKTFHSSSDSLTIDTHAFYRCKKLVNIWCKGTIKLRHQSFVDCDSLIDVGNLLIVEEESFVNCVSLEKISLCDKVSVRGNIFKNTVIKDVFCYGNVLLHNRANVSMFVNKTIHCKANSNLANLAYEGANIIFW